MAKHVVEPEELQAYLDRELEPIRQAEVERHLAVCRECATLVADLKRVSETLQRWQVEPAPPRLRPPALAASEPARARWAWNRLVLAVAGSVAVVLLVLAIGLPNLMKSRMATNVAREQPATGTVTPPPARPEERKELPAPPPAVANRGRTRVPAEKRETVPEAPSAEADRTSQVGGVLGGVPGGVPAAPQVYGVESAPARSADALSAAPAAALGGMAKKAEAEKAPRLIAYEVVMTVEVKEFNPAKAKLLKVVEQAGGYVAQANAAETPNQPRRADLVVRVPVEKLSGVLEQIRALGRVTEEQLSSEEVTEQVVDLEARLRNARATEQRLIAVLNERTGKVRDILDVEREIALKRQEIERMEAQRQMLMHRVELATVTVTLQEEFQAQLQPAPAGARTRLGNAFVEGYESFVEMLLGFVLFFARYGLTLLFWAGLLWVTWRIVRRPLLRLVGTRN